MRTSTLTVALLSALLVTSAGMAGALTTAPLQPQQSPANATTNSSDAATQGTPSVTFNDQESSGETVLVESASLSQQGFVVIYDSSRSDNRTEQIIGASYLLEPGTSDNIRIQLDEPLGESTPLLAVVHTDSNGNGEFDYVSSGGQQDPAPPSGTDRVVSLAQVTVENAGGTNESTADTANTTAPTATTTADGAANATTGETTTSGMTTTAGTTTEEPTAETTTAGETAADDATETTAAANGTAANESNGSGDSGGSGAFGPGFGPVVAVVALLAAALLASRRRE